VDRIRMYDQLDRGHDNLREQRMVTFIIVDCRKALATTAAIPFALHPIRVAHGPHR
jgi:hypothetical protein